MTPVCKRRCWPFPTFTKNWRRPGQALEAYLDAENGYTDQLVEVEQIADSLTSEQLLAALELVENDEQNSLDIQRLADFLSLQPLQNRAVDVQRLLDMREQLHQWQQKLDIFQHLLDQRRQARGDKLQMIEQRQFPEQLEQMIAQGDKHSAELQAIIDTNDVMALVSGDTADLWQRVVRAEQHLEALYAAGELSTEEQSEYRELLAPQPWPTPLAGYGAVSR